MILVDGFMKLTQGKRQARHLRDTWARAAVTEYIHPNVYVLRLKLRRTHMPKGHSAKLALTY
ncbi:hypothetical protein FVQ98_08615 [Ottowia sp. GY511]|nr:hypothetical protein FVQ98_08615 [Ottowia sp. GY511]